MGQRRDTKDELGSRVENLQFVELKDDPLGSVPSILFWNDQQRQIYTGMTSMQHTLLMGDYGTGLCIRYYLQLDIMQQYESVLYWCFV